MKQKLRHKQTKSFLRSIVIGLALLAGVVFMASPFLSSGAEMGQSAIIVDLAVTPDVLSHQHAPWDHDRYKTKAHCGVTGCIAMNDLKIWKKERMPFTGNRLVDVAPRGVNAEHELPPPRIG